jgi:two-component system CheB/CheR fusion protein
MEKKYLVAIGASAGGVAALSVLFDHTLPDAVSYVITTHLYPHQKSYLTQIIRKHSELQVCEVENGMPVLPNTVYVMPENKTMSILNGRLMLTARDHSLKVNLAIDIFFSSLAKDTHFNKIAIILSGMGKDGTKGVAAIAKNGGFVIAQTPSSSDEQSMPLHVIADGYAHRVLSPKDIPQAIIDYVNRP